MSSGSESDVQKYKVQLAIYDLSNGMASSLSRQFLGAEHAIDIIPHSGVLAYGREYYFGSGIYNDSPEQFRLSRGIQPIMILNCGETTCTRAQFERWCNEVASQEYSNTSYNLLGRNCNNFADYALRDGLGMPDGVPQWVLDVPQRFLTSPLGQMVRPMLESMHTNFARAGTHTHRPMPTPPPAQPSNHAAATPHNPWAHIPPATAPSSSTTQHKTNNNSKHTPLLDKHNSFLLSTHTAMLPGCIDKLITYTQQNQFSDTSLDAKKCQKALHQLKQQLTQSPPSADAPTFHMALRPFFSNIAQTPPQIPPSILANALLILRIVLLNPVTHTHATDDCHLNDFLQSITTVLLQPQLRQSQSATVASLSWCVLGNALGSPQRKVASFFTSSPDRLESLVDAALSDLTSRTATKELRQAAAAFLYNVAHLVTETESSKISFNSKDAEQEDVHMPDVLVTLLCGALDGCHEHPPPTDVTQEEKKDKKEPFTLDDTTTFRRLLIAARILQTYGFLASSLVIELGYVDGVQQLSQYKHTIETSAALASEVYSLLSS